GYVPTPIGQKEEREHDKCEKKAQREMQRNSGTFAATPRKRLTHAPVAKAEVQARRHRRFPPRIPPTGEQADFLVVSLLLHANLYLRAPSDLLELRDREIAWCAIARPFPRFRPTKMCEG